MTPVCFVCKMTCLHFLCEHIKKICVFITVHIGHSTGPLHLIVMGVNVLFLLADGELIEHMSTVRDMQIETVANRISTISSLVRAGAAKH